MYELTTDEINVVDGGMRAVALSIFASALYDAGKWAVENYHVDMGDFGRSEAGRTGNRAV